MYYSQATVKEISDKEEELNKVKTLGQLLNNECVEEDGEVIMQWMKELHAKWDNLYAQVIQRKVSISCDNKVITVYHPIQTQLEEALLRMGQFQQAFDELWIWLCYIYEQLSNSETTTGKIDAVATLITKHSVR